MSEKTAVMQSLFSPFLPQKTPSGIQIVLQHWILGLYKAVHAEIGRLLMVIVIAETRHKNLKSYAKLRRVGTAPLLTEQIPNDSPQTGAKSTTTSNHPSNSLSVKAS